MDRTRMQNRPRTPTTRRRRAKHSRQPPRSRDEGQKAPSISRRQRTRVGSRRRRYREKTRRHTHHAPCLERPRVSRRFSRRARRRIPPALTQHHRRHQRRGTPIALCRHHSRAGSTHDDLLLETREMGTGNRLPSQLVHRRTRRRPSRAYVLRGSPRLRAG